METSLIKNAFCIKEDNQLTGYLLVPEESGKEDVISSVIKAHQNLKKIADELDNSNVAFALYSMQPKKIYKSQLAENNPFRRLVE